MTHIFNSKVSIFSVWIQILHFSLSIKHGNYNMWNLMVNAVTEKGEHMLTWVTARVITQITVWTCVYFLNIIVFTDTGTNIQHSSSLTRTSHGKWNCSLQTYLSDYFVFHCCSLLDFWRWFCIHLHLMHWLGELCYLLIFVSWSRGKNNCVGDPMDWSWWYYCSTSMAWLLPDPAVLFFSFLFASLFLVSGALIDWNIKWEC